MKNKIIYLLMVLFLVSCGSSTTPNPATDSQKGISSPKITAQSILSNMEKGKYVEGELLVKFKSGMSASSLKAHKSVGATSLRRFSAIANLEHVKLPKGMLVKDAIVRYMSDPNVEYAEPNYIRRISKVPNDPFFNPQQWALQNTGTFASGTAGDDIKAPGAWDTTTGSQNVIIAVLDTGIDYTHNDLAVNIWRNLGETSCSDGIDNDGNGFVDDCKGWDFTTCANFDLVSPDTTATALLDGAQVVPPVATSATGSASLTVNLETGAISGTLIFSGLGSNATEAHIHQGAVGTNGSSIVALTGGAGATSGTWVVPGGTFLTANQLTQLEANGLYIDVSSTAQSAGEIRGQIIPTGDLTCITPKEPDNDPMDDNGHGTHVAGIIGAKGDNGIGTAGLMWNVQLVPLKVLNANGVGQLSDILVALGYVIENVEHHGVQIKAVNASFGGSEFSASERDAITMLQNDGILFVAAAGNAFNNNDITPVFPAGYSNPLFGGLLNIISVAATDQQDRLATFSGFGVNSVHVGAPGVYILSTVPGGYDFLSGTSMAAPHVAGLAGLLYSYYDGVHNTLFDIWKVRATILGYTDQLPTLSGLVLTGGRINAYKAVSSLLVPEGLTATAQSSSQISLTWTDKATGEDGYHVERMAAGGSFVRIATLGPNVTTFTDSGLTASTAYTYQVKAFNNIAESFPSAPPASATTLAPDAPPPVTSSSDGGGGCSIGARQNVPSAMADLGVLLMPLLIFAILRRRR